MLEFRKSITYILFRIYGTTELKDCVYVDELDLDYDFNIHKVGIYYQTDTMSNEFYKDTIDLDLNFYALKKNEAFMLEIIDTFSKELEKLDMGDYWITHKNVYLLKIIEDDLVHYVLSFNVNKY